MWYNTTSGLTKKRLVQERGETVIVECASGAELAGQPRRVQESPKLPPLGQSRYDRFDLAPRTGVEFLAELTRRYGSVLRAFRFVNPMNHKGRLTFPEFRQAYEKLGYTKKCRSVWFLLDADLNGELSLDELDPETYGILEKFYWALTSRFGSLENGWRRYINVENVAAIPYAPFHQACKCLGFEDRQIDLLFKCFDLDNLGTITYDEVEFLDAWADAKQTQRKLSGPSWLNKDPYFYMGNFELWAEGTIPDLGLLSADERRAVAKQRQGYCQRLPPVPGAGPVVHYRPGELEAIQAMLETRKRGVGAQGGLGGSPVRSGLSRSSRSPTKTPKGDGHVGAKGAINRSRSWHH